MSETIRNNGVSLVSRKVQVSSAKYLNPIETNDRGIKYDDLGFRLVNFSRQGHKKNKYVSVHQVKQIFYVEDPSDANWCIVLKSTTRDYHDMYNKNVLEDTTL
ncbi:hypothetical protein POM88_025743 [Heracleum sosnowskyi]|uniref:DUF4216 domain-containing protein n=1 Tax=Heracleum sosnowskyi TaxID=360622 RepID=A0AAD8I4H1_9APIA|nr:hypothetical protein POM88_025743 [Heracleum sosnowskyi]